MKYGDSTENNMKLEPNQLVTIYVDITIPSDNEPQTHSLSFRMFYNKQPFGQEVKLNLTTISPQKKEEPVEETARLEPKFDFFAKISEFFNKNDNNTPFEEEKDEEQISEESFEDNW